MIIYIFIYIYYIDTIIIKTISYNMYIVVGKQPHKRIIILTMTIISLDSRSIAKCLCSKVSAPQLISNASSPKHLTSSSALQTAGRETPPVHLYLTPSTVVQSLLGIDSHLLTGL